VSASSHFGTRALLTLALLVIGACRFDPSGPPASATADGAVDLPVDAAPAPDLPVDAPAPDLPDTGPTPDLPDTGPTPDLPDTGPTPDLPDTGPTPDLPADTGPVPDLPDDTGPAPDLTVDALILPDTTKPCPVCQGQTPICDPTTGTCRACASHAECPAELCAADGSCPDESLIAYVHGAKCATSQKTGTAAEPYCLIDEAVGKGKLYILVKQSTYAKDLILDQVTHEIYGEPGAVIQPSACDKLEIKGGSNVLLQGFAIAGNVLVSAGTATLAQNVIGPSSCVGVISTATVTLRRNLVVQHTLGGMDLGGTYHVENNFIVQNGTTAGKFGGVKLGTANGAFINNTVVDNTCQTKGPAEAGGVRCEVNPPRW
jgi:hypothetical protein